MKKNEVSNMVCSIARSVKEIGDTWKILILRELFLHNRRFEQILTQTGMSSYSLATRLTELEQDAIIEKRPYQTNPTRYEYFLTEKGIDLWPMMVALNQWGDRWHRENDERPLRIVHKNCGPTSEPILVCSECAEPMHARKATTVMSDDSQRYRTERMQT